MDRRTLNLHRTHSSASTLSSYRRQRNRSFKSRHHSSPLDTEYDLDDDDFDFGAEIQMTAAVSGVVPDDTFTVAQAVNALGFGKFQLVLTFVTGLCWMADSMEVMILSILSPALHCEWGTSQYYQALLTASVFIGMSLGSVVWGKLSDKFGRKPALILASFFLFFYGVLSAFSPNYPWMLFLRFMVGFNIGCVPQSVTLYAEFLPTKQRGKCVVLLDCFWAFGACFEILLAAVIMPFAGWRWLLALSALPSLLFVCAACAWLPESVRFKSTCGQSDEALKTLEDISEQNNKPMLLGRLIVDDDLSHILARGRFSDLLDTGLRRTTLSLWLIWTSCSFIYYGMVLMTTELFESPGDNICALDGSLEKTCSAQCSPLDRDDYGRLIWTTLAEFPGIMLTIALIDRIGRKRVMTMEFAMLSLTLCFLFYCTASRNFLTFVLFAIRSMASGVFQAAYVYTPEVYPTILRAVGVGSCSAIARLGAMLTPYVAQVLMKESLFGAVAVYAGVAMLAASVCLSLREETRGNELKDTSRTSS